MCLNCKAVLLGLWLAAAPFTLLAEASTGGTGQQLEITTQLGDQHSFRSGDRIQFLLSLQPAAYVYLYYLDAAGDVWQLLPGPWQEGNFYPAGLYQPIPAARSNFEFVSQPPFGQESLWAFAVDRPLTPPPGNTLPNGLLKLDYSIADLRAYFRQHDPERYSETTLTIFTKP